MADRSPGPEGQVPLGKVVPLHASRPLGPNLWLHPTHLTDDTPALLVITTDGDQAYLFPREILSLAGDLLSTDPASLVQADAGRDVTMFFGAGRTAALGQAIAICRARRQGDRG